MALEHHSHGYGQCAFHIVLVPRYRHNIFLDAKLQKRCAELLVAISECNGFRVHVLQIAPDHMHIFPGIGSSRSIRGDNRVEVQLCKGALHGVPPTEAAILVKPPVVQRQILPVDRERDRGDDTALHRPVRQRLAIGYPKRT